MSMVSVGVPEFLHKQLQEMALREGVSVSQLAATAIAEKLSALTANDVLEHRAARGDRGRFEQALAKVGAAAVPEADQL